MAKDAHVVTGAFGYSGRWIAKELLNCGHRVITRAEIRGLMNGLMASDDEPLGVVKFSEWIEENGAKLGLRYQNDMKERKYQTTSLFHNSPNSTK